MDTCFFGVPLAAIEAQGKVAFSQVCAGDPVVVVFGFDAYLGAEFMARQDADGFHHQLPALGAIGGKQELVLVVGIVGVQPEIIRVPMLATVFDGGHTTAFPSVGATNAFHNLLLSF